MSNYHINEYGNHAILHIIINEFIPLGLRPLTFATIYVGEVIFIYEKLTSPVTPELLSGYKMQIAFLVVSTTAPELLTVWDEKYEAPKPKATITDFYMII